MTETIMKKLLLVITLLLSSMSVAQTVEVEFGFATRHYFVDDIRHLLNEDNKFVAISVGNIAFASFENSYFNQSVALGYRVSNDYVGLTFGVIDGYEKHQLVMPEFMWLNDSVMMYVAPDISLPLNDTVAIRARILGLAVNGTVVLKF